MLEQGDRAPEFEMTDGEGKLWRLSDLRGKKVILYFYPADDTPGCTIQACDFRDSQKELTDAGFIVLGVSPQGAASHQRFAAKYDLNFPLLVDEDTSVARAYGAYKDDGSEYKGIPLKIKRSTFVIDEEGRIDRALYGVSAKGHVASLMETVDA
ncbi:MAG: peroxiredoxin [Actinomycetota bacterium]